MEQQRKKIVALDMWSSPGVVSGPSKLWLYDQLNKEFDIEIISLPKRYLNELILLCRAFTFNKKSWAENYCKLKESDVKTPSSFRALTRKYSKKLKRLPYRPDLVFQLGGLFGPVGFPGVPYISYHDQTVSMVESGWKDWLPVNFNFCRDEFYTLEKKLFNSLDKIITYSDATKKSFNRDYGIDNKSIDVIYAAAKISYPDSAEVYRKRKRQLLFVSTNFHLKGGDIVVESLPLIKKKFPNIRLVIAGAKNPSEINVDDSAIEYVGSLSTEELERYYCESEILLYPARYDAFPNVLKEAVVCGLPAIASTSCGIPEILDQGRAGILLENISAQELAHQVVDLLENPGRYRQIQQRCLEIRDRYKPAVAGERFIETFRSLLEKAGTD